MRPSFQLKPMSGEHHSTVREVYEDAIQSQGHCFYTKDQIQAWAGLAWLPGILEKPLTDGKGWVSIQNLSIEAFAVRYPMNRLALLYCRGRSSRKGLGTSLLKVIEDEARREGQTRLITEASSFSYPLFLKHGWVLETPEIIKIGGIPFTRYLMIKNFL
ncbi:GNAT family N-acetyltransferase [Prochlorococcus sp. MIT 1223]|uniref:GNAT family N-acetyltransferase n=1 Tax=Prochlorococcus sp. MIT 1223 TaxID=3096217 RepID=UPI002A7631C1|nr:GNAT family N-acetyltransferase [Prochlorococcus sp. MIT 1223]